MIFTPCSLDIHDQKKCFSGTTTSFGSRETYLESIFEALGREKKTYIYTIMYTMCPPGCYHNGFMAAPEFGHRMYGYTLLDCIVESQECSNCKQ